MEKSEDQDVRDWAKVMGQLEQLNDLETSYPDRTEAISKLRDDLTGKVSVYGRVLVAVPRDKFSGYVLDFPRLGLLRDINHHCREAIAIQKER